MIDREKVIQALQCRSHASERCENPCAETGYCHYSYQIIDGSGEPIYPFICNKKQICEDAIALLKAQEPVEPKVTVYHILPDGACDISPRSVTCGACGEWLIENSDVIPRYKYCPQCGRKVKWG